MKNKLIYVLKYILKLPSKVEVKAIEFYQKYISTHTRRHCIYFPTCSEYTRQAVDKYGIIKGNFKGIIRIIKCNPFSSGGIDYLK